MELKLSYREKTGKGANRKLQAMEKYPAIIYGGKENTSVSGECSAIAVLFLATDGKTKIINIEIDREGKTEKKRAIIQDYQYSSIRKKFIHIDFLEVTDNTKLHLEVPIQTSGTSKIIQMGGIMQVIRHTIPITCQAKDIPEYIEVDVTELDFGTSIHILDVKFPEGVKPVITGRNFTLITAAGVAEEAIERRTEEAEDATKVEAVKQKEPEAKEESKDKKDKNSKDF